MEANRTPRLRRTLARTLVALVVVETGWLSYPTLRARLLALEETPARRGQRLAAELGCFSCHGPGGGGGTKNPGSEEGTVPAFTERTQMMYVKTTDDLREYVLDGAPRRKRDDADYRAKVEKAALRMPSYRRFVTARQVDDLVAFLRGGVGNPGSLKGYVPGFWGADFDDLVHGDDELHTWIAKGALARVTEHPIGGRFFKRQAIKMPAYEHFVPEADVDALAAYVRWIRAGSWRPLIR